MAPMVAISEPKGNALTWSVQFRGHIIVSKPLANTTRGDLRRADGTSRAMIGRVVIKDVKVIFIELDTAVVVPIPAPGDEKW
jgi:hypothetical protein